MTSYYVMYVAHWFTRTGLCVTAKVAAKLGLWYNQVNPICRRWMGTRYWPIDSARRRSRMAGCQTVRMGVSVKGRLPRTACGD